MNDIPTHCAIALKEWAVTLTALDSGHQILLLRKGGIREEGKEFRVLYPHFFLYPTFEHQREDLLKAELHLALRETINNKDPQDTITLTHWAQVVQSIEVTDQEAVDALSPLYIWTTDYAQKRLHWKPKKPLQVMLLRVYRLKEPRTAPVLPRYAGCKSWVELEQEIPLGEVTPVMSSQQYLSQAEAVTQMLRMSPVPA